LFAGVVERVLIAGRAAVQQQPNQGRVAPLDRSEQRRHAPLSAPLHGVAVRVGSGVEQQLCATPHIRRRAGRPAQQHQQRRQTADLGSRRIGLQRRRQRRRVGEHQRPLDAAQVAGLDLVYQLGPAGEPVLTGKLVLRLA
jgi:hypothetical protein